MTCPVEGDPCNPATGNETESETDYASPKGDLRVQRYYASQGVGDGYAELGQRWRHNYAKRMEGYDTPFYHMYYGPKSSLFTTKQQACHDGWNELKSTVYQGMLSDTDAAYQNGVCEISRGVEIVAKLVIHNTLYAKKDSDILTFTQTNGQIIAYSNQGGVWLPLYPGKTSLVLEEDGWKYHVPGGSLETYNANGFLVSSKDTNGRLTSFSYNDQGHLETVAGAFGDTLTYHYEGDRLTGVTTPDGGLGYGYDEAGRLNRVTYPDGSEKQYHYEDSRFPYHLTAISDEKGERYASWAYDDQGRAILSEHANGNERVEFTYNSDSTTTITDAAGAERTYHFVMKQGSMKVDRIEGDRCATCANGGIRSYAYDVNGFVVSRTDWNGNVTSYTRDAQGRELSRTEGAGTPEARTVTTTWDTDLNKPLSITEPERIIEYHYSPEGRLLSREERPRS